MTGEIATSAQAVAFIWLGMVMAISFLETSLKLRALGITAPLDLAVALHRAMLADVPGRLLVMRVAA